MPGVDGFEPGDAFILRIFKRKTTNPSIVWSNSYEFVAYAGGGLSDLLTCAQEFMAFEQELHCTSTEFVRQTFSTWVPDSRPYNPANFVVWDATGTLGEYVELGGGPAPLTSTWSVRRVARYGRSGKLFYRNCLLQDQIIAPSGVATLANPVLQAGRITDAMDNANIGQYLGLEPVRPLGLVMKGLLAGSILGATTLRPVMDMVSFGLSIVDLDHKYYDIPEPTP